MREIKFRGLTKKGKWVHGSYIQSGVDVPCIVFGDGEQEEVIPKTAGQYTGLKDSKGTEVYEKDLFDINGRIYLVVYQDANFRLVDNKSNRSLSAGCVHIKGFVCGNIHQNPELLD